MRVGVAVVEEVVGRIEVLDEDENGSRDVIGPKRPGVVVEDCTTAEVVGIRVSVKAEVLDGRIASRESELEL